MLRLAVLTILPGAVVAGPAVAEDETERPSLRNSQGEWRNRRRRTSRPPSGNSRSSAVVALPGSSLAARPALPWQAP